MHDKNHHNASQGYRADMYVPSVLYVQWHGHDHSSFFWIAGKADEYILNHYKVLYPAELHCMDGYVCAL